MDDETKNILSELNKVVLKQQKPIWLNLLQAFGVPMLTVLFTIVVTLNKIENKTINTLNQIEVQLKERETEDKFIRSELGIIKRRQDYNNTIIENEINEQIKGHIQLIDLE